MAVSGIITNDGCNMMWRRLYGDVSTSAVSLFAVGTGTTTVDATNTGLETIITNGFTGPATYKAFVAGWPTYDPTNNRVTSRAYVSSTECNGNTISEAAEFNSDSTKVILSHDVFTGIVKNSATEIAIVWKHDLVNV